MRIRHLIYAVAASSAALAVARDPTGRVVVIVFATGLGEAAFATAALLALFQTVGALGEARGLAEQVHAVAATSAVLAAAAALMAAWLFAGAWLVSVSV